MLWSTYGTLKYIHFANIFFIKDPFELIYNSYEWLKQNKLLHFGNLFNIFTENNIFMNDFAPQDSFTPETFEFSWIRTSQNILLNIPTIQFFKVFFCF